MASFRSPAQVDAPMGRPRSRAFVACSVVLAALAAAAVAQGPEPLEERFTSCWPCHVAWPTPLKTFYHILPPQEAGGAGGEVFDYGVQVRNAWLHDITFLEPSLDLSNAPSLKFYDGREPVDLEARGVIVVDPTTPMEPQTGHVVLEIPTGATDMTLVLTPLSPLSPVVQHDVRMNLFPGATGPNGTPAVTKDDAGAGQPETFTTDDEADLGFASLGFGNWTVQAEVSLLGAQDPTKASLGDEIPFRVDAHVEFNANDITTQYLSQRVLIRPDGSHIVTWRLQPVGTPGPEETVTLRVDAEVHWDHLPSSNADDYANVTKTMEIPVVGQDGQVLLVTDELPPVPGPALIGISMAAVSEAVGYATSFLLVASVYTGGMFGKASRRQLNKVLGSAKRRVAFHNFLSYGLTVAAVVHLVLFLIETKYHWTLGLIWGGVALLAMIGLGLTGALQVPMIRKWTYSAWRWSHLILAIASLVFTLVHFGLDGAHFGTVQEAVGWQDPLDNRGLFAE